ncbi:hypothetical protein LSAT2_007927, partial [Lamellibrachia satsuma]
IVDMSKDLPEGEIPAVFYHRKCRSIFTMKKLLDAIIAKQNTIMNFLGIVQVKDTTKKHTRRKLESEFGGALHLFPGVKGKLFLYPDNLSMCELAKDNQSLKTELHTLKSLSAKDVVANAAL